VDCPVAVVRQAQSAQGSVMGNQLQPQEALDVPD
jgi:hypothetical protein